MKFARYIAALAVSIISVACSLNELDEPVDIGRNDGSSVNVHARISNYYDYDVDTRSAKSPEEAVVSSMALAVFPIENDAIQPCVDYYFEEGQKVTFTIDRTNTIYDNAANKPFAMYIFANMSNMPKTLAEVKAANDGGGMTVEDFVILAHTVEKSYYGNADYPGLPDTGFPMMGSLGDNVSKDGEGTMLADGKELILKPTVSKDNPHSLPLVGNNPTDLLNIPMKAMYAKFSFDITVNPTQTIEGNTQSFTLTSYTLHNIPRTVDFDMTSNDDEDVIADEDVNNDEITIYDNSVTVEGGGGEGAIQFSFYIPERYLEPTISAAEYDYPFMEDGEIRDEDMNLRQRYKPDLIGDDKKATYVTINGKYLDHNARTWDVSYNIYLGADNYGDFNIIRNSHYSNNIAIRGITNSDDMSNADGAISIDHRVNITRSLPIIESLRRETLLDSHFEVRPLRIRAVAGEPEVTVTIKPNDGTNNTPDWIRLEHKNSAQNTDYLPSGKRKYFTTDLVTSTLVDGEETFDGDGNITNVGDPTKGAQVQFTSGINNDCIWIYVDECTDIYDPGTNDDPVRSAKIVIDVDGQRAEYIINQSKLYKISVTTDDYIQITDPKDEIRKWGYEIIKKKTREYYIESYEEYLYNYDAEDTYTANQTFFEGMKWGLEGVQLSGVGTTDKHGSVWLVDGDNYTSLKNAGGIEAVVTDVINYLSSYYDFYVAKHDFDIDTPDRPHERAGHHFCSEIITDLKGTTDEIGVLALNQTPQSAIEYCYNKNKRNADGEVVSMDWYLPAIDEIEDIMVGAYDSFDGVFQSQDYWSCQPSYHRNYLYWSIKWGSLWGNIVYNPGIGGQNTVGNADYYVDNVDRARSTRATFQGFENNMEKFTYNPSGIKKTSRIKTNGVEEEPYPTTTQGGNDITIQQGYYTWAARRGMKDSDSKKPGDNGINTSQYDYDKWYYNNTPILPEYGYTEEYQKLFRESGNMSRDVLNRIRCVRKMN